MKKKLELRMYGFVPYNISPIQQGIQFGHAVVEYQLKYGKSKEYQEWAKNWKTFIILNGGTSNHSQNRYQKGISGLGSMEKNITELSSFGVKFATFYEPDLNDMLSAIVFIVDERIFNKEKYPDFDSLLHLKQDSSGKYSYPRFISDYKKMIGGEQNYKIREFLKKFRLA